MNQTTVGRQPSWKAARRFFTLLSLLGLLIASGAASLPVLAARQAQTADTAAVTCAGPYCVALPAVISPRYCTVGQAMPDPSGDVSNAAIDVTSLTTSINGTQLTTTFNLRDVPTALTFNRYGVSSGSLEYGWDVHVDIDNNPNTGYPYYPYKGGEMILAANHFVSQPDHPVLLPIQNSVQVNTWLYDSSIGGWRYATAATLTVDPSGNTLRMTGTIPGLNPSSRVLFETYDDNPTGSIIRDLSYCSTLESASADSPEMTMEEAAAGWQLAQDEIRKLGK